ncbi:hypothetical protein LINPERHAP2_LOCUS31781 [Linum perenne]
MLCDVGMLIRDKPIIFSVFKHRMTNIWCPNRGMSVKKLGNKMMLFRFYHTLDL